MRAAIVSILVLALAGCSLVEQGSSGRSPLVNADPSPDSVSLEVFFARTPIANKETAERLWKQIDEQSLPAELRRKLGENGFRVGIVGAPLPSELTSLLKLSDRPHDDKQKGQIDLKAEPTVTMRLMQMRPGQPGELIASTMYDDLPLLANEDGEVGGRVYHKAQGIFMLRTSPATDGRLRLDLTPELQHGEAKIRRVVSEGMLRMEPGRDKKIFDDLAISAELTPGQMLVLTCQPAHSGSIGYKFFTEPT